MTDMLRTLDPRESTAWVVPWLAGARPSDALACMYLWASCWKSRTRSRGSDVAYTTDIICAVTRLSGDDLLCFVQPCKIVESCASV